MTPSIITSSFISIGATRHPSASSWDRNSGILAFGAGCTIALWEPESKTLRGVIKTLKGHTDKINAVRFLPGRKPEDEAILSAGADKTIRIWQRMGSREVDFELAWTIEPGVQTHTIDGKEITVAGHEGSINHIAVAEAARGGSKLFATASADGTVKVWSLDIRRVKDSPESALMVECLQTITTKPKFFPLSVALIKLSDDLLEPSWMLAVAGSTNSIQIYANYSLEFKEFAHVATLTGHENWVRSLSFTTENGGDILLASASQDRYIRLWRIHRGLEVPGQSAGSSDQIMGGTLSNKAHRFHLPHSKEDYTITFEALLVGHEDWVYTADWKTSLAGTLQLLTSSADNSLSIWEPEEASGIWTCISRLGEISTSKGSSTATGSAGGFWSGMWSPDGKSVVSLGKTGSWRRWNYIEEEDNWVQAVSISGHVRDVMGLAWGGDGEYLLSTSLDQSTRLYARWTASDSWHEFARPQIHGYDINCISSLGSTRFVSGSDEKLLRVFDEPKTIATLLEKLCNITLPTEVMPDAANVPVLSLSNKAIATTDDTEPTEQDRHDESIDPSSVQSSSTLDISHPPLEDHLSRHTLWPESEKLYGHGYEISAVAGSHSGHVIATACRATTVEHAVIRLFETKTWRQVKPNLELHSLTVTRLAFSPDDRYLLSVGRDRQWAVFERGEDVNTYTVLKTMPKPGHTRILWDGKWSPISGVFATASRDKTVKVWAINGSCYATIKFDEPVTAVEFCPEITADRGVVMVVGTESGALFMYCAKEDALQCWELVEKLNEDVVPDKSVTQICWRAGGGRREFAVSSEDASVRLFEVKI